MEGSAHVSTQIEGFDEQFNSKVQKVIDLATSEQKDWGAALLMAYALGVQTATLAHQWNSPLEPLLKKLQLGVASGCTSTSEEAEGGKGIKRATSDKRRSHTDRMSYRYKTKIVTKERSSRTARPVFPCPHVM